MPLTAVAIRNLKPAEKPFKATDGGGLHLMVTPAGGKLWRMNYRFAGQQQTLALGAYPEIGLAEARAARGEAKRLLARGINPTAEKKARKQASAPAPELVRGPTIGDLVQRFIEKRRLEDAAQSTIDKMGWFTAAIGDEILSMHPDDLEPRKFLERLRFFEQSGKLEKVARTRNFLARVYNFAIASGDARSNPALGLADALAAPQPTHYAAIFDPDEFGRLLRSLDCHSGDPSVFHALRVGPHIALRSSEIRGLRWNFVRWDENLIRVPGELMKNDRDHLLPMSRQVRVAFEAVLPWSGPGGGRTSKGLIFPGVSHRSRTLSENTLNNALHALGYGKDVVTFHGFRRTFSTWLNETGLFEPDWVELQLDHVDNNKTRRIYNAAEYLEHRRRMLQWWSDHLDDVKLNRGLGKSA